MKYPTSNFKPFLEKLMPKLTKETFNPFADNIYFLEKKMLERDFDYYGLHVRYISELLIPIIKIPLRRNGVSAKRLRGLINLKHLEKFGDSISGESELDTVKWLKDQGNHFVHNNIEHSSEIFDEPRMNNLKFEEIIKILEKLHNILNWSLETSYVFDKSKYFPQEIVESRKENKYLFDLVGEECPICFEGKYSIEKRIPGKPGMIHGPYLKCSLCKAITSSNLKIKNEVDDKCNECGSNLKSVLDLTTGERFFMCKDVENCHWRGVQKDGEEEIKNLSDIVDDLNSENFLDLIANEEEKIYDHIQDKETVIPVWDDSESAMELIDNNPFGE